MSAENAIVAVCDGPARAAESLLELARHGVELGCLSAIAADRESETAPAAYYVKDGLLRKAGQGDGGYWRMLSNWSVLVIPGEPAILAAGPFAACVVQAIENGMLFGDLGPVARALYSLGIPRESACRYALAVRQGRALVIVQGRSRDVAQARSILANSRQ